MRRAPAPLVALGVAQVVVERGVLEDLALLGRRHLQQQVVHLRQRLVHALAVLGALDQRRQLQQLEVARPPPATRRGRCRAASPPAARRPATTRVEQLVAHHPEGRVQALGRAEQLLLEHLLLARPSAARASSKNGDGRARARRRARAGLGPGQHEPLARARHRHVQQPAHLALVGLALGARRGRRSFSSASGTASAAPARGPGHARGRQPEHQHVVELAPLGRVHRHHAHGARRARGGAASSSRQPGLGDRGHVAGEVARRAPRLAAHEGGRQLGQLGDVDEPLDGVGLRGEHLLAAQPDPLDQPVHEQRPAGISSYARAAER